MLSLAAAMVLTTTSAMAFDANSSVKDGVGVSEIMTYSPSAGYIKKDYNPNFETGTQVTSGYVNGEGNSTVNLALSTTGFGDALIYPAFRVADGWNTQMTVTNTSSTNAVVAKVVLYASDDSRELIDFNIYLSQNDVFTFNVTDAGVTTSDDSIEVDASRAQDVTAAADTDTVTMNTYGTTRTLTSALPVNSGYAIVYAMAEAFDANATKDGTNIAGLGAELKHGYHKDHADLFLDYRELLDTCRIDNSTAPVAAPNDVWRQSLVSSTVMTNGMIRSVIQAPLVLAACDDVNGTTNYRNKTQFGTPTAGILFGSEVMSNDLASGDETRNLMINATALANYTSPGQMMLWTAGEAAGITDRRMVSDALSANAKDDLDEAGILADATTFDVNTTYYSYDSGHTANALHITSPVKRGLVQAQGNNSYWSGVASTKVYGEFDFSRFIYNDQEDKYTVATSINTGVIVSPYNPDAAALPEAAILQESLGLSNLQKPAVDSDATKYAKGYVEVGFLKSGAASKYPGLISQMSASTVNGKSLTNWFYAPIQK